MMDYAAILQKSWNVTWRYKILWLFGFFAGAGTGGSANFNTSNWNQSSGSSQDLPAALRPEQVQQFLERYAPILIVGALFLVALGILMMVVAVAARGGLIHLVNEAEEGREVRAAAGWHVGFSKWWRVFGAGFLADLPLAALGIVIAVFVAVTAIGAWATTRGSSEEIGAAVAAAIAGLCVFAVVFGIAAIFLGVVLGIVKELALRYIVLQDRRVMDALKTAWRDLWAKRGAFLMYLVQVGVGIAFGIMVAIVAVVTVVPAGVMMYMGNYAGGAIVLGLAVLVLMLPSAWFGAFYHAVWTIFFRRMTGAEVVAPKPAPAAYPPVPPVGYPPAPPAPPASVETSPAPFVPPAPPAEQPSGPADA